MSAQQDHTVKLTIYMHFYINLGYVRVVRNEQGTYVVHAFVDGVEIVLSRYGNIQNASDIA